MKSALKVPGPGRHAGEAARKQLIRREMRFVLQQDIHQFTKLLLARLLDEGCNLHPDLARIMFYARFERRLAFGLPAGTRTSLGEKMPGSEDDWTHPRYHAAVKYFLTRLPDAEMQITATVLDVVEALKLHWQQTAEKCLANVNLGGADLQNLIEQIFRANPDGKLARHDFVDIRRRLKIAVVASLLRHICNPDPLREKYGSVPQILQSIGSNPSLWPGLLAAFKKQIPYAQHVIAQSFWRTLNNMDTELT